MYTLDASVALTDNKMLRLAAILHDVGKPDTRSSDEKGIHFYKHEAAGANTVQEWMKAMKFSSKDTEYVTKIVRFHQFRFETRSKDKTIRRWLRDVGNEWRDLLTLRAADRKGNMAKQNKPMITKSMRELIEKAENIIKSGDPIFDKDLAISGDDLKSLGIKPGPVYKDIFEKVWSLVLSEPSKNNKTDLIEFVQKRCKDAIGSTGNSENLDRGIN
jgi:tRNA nucleotidyltransferase (CCA-adding enzyme)